MRSLEVWAWSEVLAVVDVGAFSAIDCLWTTYRNAETYGALLQACDRITTIAMDDKIFSNERLALSSAFQVLPATLKTLLVHYTHYGGLFSCEDPVGAAAVPEG
ncbi:hypothetical protein JCM9279_000198 [Rhodotorula babjevae]